MTVDSSDEKLSNLSNNKGIKDMLSKDEIHINTIKLGGLVDVRYLNNEIEKIPGIDNIETIRTDSNRSIPGLSFCLFFLIGLEYLVQGVGELPGVKEEEGWDHLDLEALAEIRELVRVELRWRRRAARGVGASAALACGPPATRERQTPG